MAELTYLQLECERMPEHVLLSLHMKYLNQCLQHDLFKDISDLHCKIMLEALGAELRIRMSSL